MQFSDIVDEWTREFGSFWSEKVSESWLYSIEFRAKFVKLEEEISVKLSGFSNTGR